MVHYESLSRRVSSGSCTIFATRASPARVHHYIKSLAKFGFHTRASPEPFHQTQCTILDSDETLSRALSSECTTSFPGKPNENIGTKINGNTRLLGRIVRLLFVRCAHGPVWSVLVHVCCVLVRFTHGPVRSVRFLFGCLLRIIDRYIFLVNNVI